MQLINAPEWTAVERFDIAARLPADVEPTPAAQSAMVRAMLEDRFALRVHREMRELPVLALVGAFQIEMTFAAEPTDVTQPSLETALTEQLGLRLESTRAPVDVLVVDSLDRPTPD